MAEESGPGPDTTPTTVRCGGCGGVVPRSALDPEATTVPCSYCDATIDLAEGAAVPARSTNVDFDALGPCKNCGAAFEEPGFDVHHGLLTCTTCTSVFDLSAGRYAAWYRQFGNWKDLRELPSSCITTRALGTTTLQCRKPATQDPNLFILPTALGLIGTMASIQAYPEYLPWNLLISLAVTALIALPVIADRTAWFRIGIRDGHLVANDNALLRSRPDVRIPVNRISQLYVRFESWSFQDGSTDYGYRLFALLDDGESKPVLGHFGDMRAPIAMERWIERRLRIDDRAVVGEYSPGP